MDRKAIGGYYELELPVKVDGLEKNGFILVNSGRNALQIILQSIQANKLYLPYYTCNVLLEPLIKLGIEYDFYHIDESLLPILEIVNDDWILLTNYYGILDDNIKKLIKNRNKIIVDNSQAYYSDIGDYSFKSPRKFFGVPDGGIALGDFNTHNLNLKEDTSSGNSIHLLKRLDISPESGYSDFINSELAISKKPMRKMSRLTRALLNGIDYALVKEKREVNFKYLHENIGSYNELTYIIPQILNGPMVYPFLIQNGRELRRHLIRNRIFVAQYWPNVLEWLGDKNGTWEERLVNDLVPLTIDQRYGIEEMEIVLGCINKWIHENK